jgi:anti-sigma regulatory factor (Ser/Thr protein kinase)/CBS domain-containing protein
MCVKEFMTQPVITIKTSNKVKQAKEILRIKKISGLPVVDENQKLVGIISVDDIIQALEAGQMDDIVANWMSWPVYCLRADDSILVAIEKFKNYRVGRFPVLDNQDRIVGILTPGDLLVGFLFVFQNKHSNPGIINRKENDLLQTNKQDSRQDIRLNYHILGGDFSSAGEASSNIKKVLQQAGFLPDVIRRVAIAAYEAEMNVIIHAYEGDMIVHISPEEIKITVIDRGPGILDIELAMQEGYSTAPDQIREMGFGAGMGLPNIKRCSDDLKIQSIVQKGTTLDMVFKPQT